MRKPTLREGLLSALFAVTAILTLYRPPPKFVVSEAVAQVTCAALPYTFVNGTVADAGQVNANFNAVVSCIQQVQSAPYVNTLVQLKATSTLAFTTGVWRLTYATGSGADPLFYVPSTVACTLNSGNGDNGSQVKSSNNKCWLAVFPASGVDARQFGLLSTGDGTAILQATADATFSLGLPRSTMLVPISANFTTFVIYPGMTLKCGGVNNKLFRSAVGPGIGTTDIVGTSFPQDNVVPYVAFDNCYVTTSTFGLEGFNVTLNGVENWSVKDSSFTNSGGKGVSFTGSIGANFTGTGSGTNLTVTAVNGIIHPGTADTASLSGTGVPANTYIVSQTSGVTGGAGVYVTNNATTSSGDALGTTSNQLDFANVTRTVGGGMQGGLMILCANCAVDGNTHPIVASGISTPATLTARMQSTITSQVMVGVSTFSYTDRNGTATRPSANFACLGGPWGCFIGQITNSTAGYDYQLAANRPVSCGTAGDNAMTTPIGYYLGSTQTNGGQKANQNQFTNLFPACDFIGVFNENGSDNHFDGADCEFVVVCALIGTGASTSNTIVFDRPYCEGYSSGDPTLVCMMVDVTSNARGLAMRNTGSTSQTTTLMNSSAGTNVTWDIAPYQTLRTSNMQVLSYELAAAAQRAQPTMVNGGNQGFGIIGSAGTAVASELQGWGGAVPTFLCGVGSGTSAVPAILNAQGMCRMQAAGQYDSTIGHFKLAAKLDIYSGSAFSNTNAESGILISTVPNGSTTVTDRWRFMPDGSLTADSLTAHGAGVVNAKGYYANDTAGADCGAGVTAANVRVVKGIVTVCN